MKVRDESVVIKRMEENSGHSNSFLVALSEGVSFLNNRISPSAAICGPWDFHKQQQQDKENGSIRSGSALITTSRDDLMKEIETKDFLEIIRHEVNYFYEFMNPCLQNEFREFANRYSKGRSGDFLLVSLLIVTVLLVPQSIIQVYLTCGGYFISTANLAVIMDAVSILAMLSIITAAFVGWILYFQEYIFTLPWISKRLRPAAVPLLNRGEMGIIPDEVSVRSSNISDPLSVRPHHIPQPLPSGSTAVLSSNPNSLCQNNLLEEGLMNNTNNKTNPSVYLNAPRKNSKPLSNKSIHSSSMTIPSRNRSFLQRSSLLLWSDQRFTKQQLLDTLSSCFMLQFQLFFIIEFFKIVFHFNCFPSESNQREFENRWIVLKYSVINIFGNDTCMMDPHVKTHDGFFNSYSLQLFLLPFIFWKGLPQTPIKTIWLNHLLASITFLVSMIADSTYQSFPSGIVWMLLTWFTIRDFQVRNMMLFLSTRNVKETMVSRNKAMEENHANEMRHLIANVAHDLKTPLASFTTGLDFIQISIDEYEASLSDTNPVGKDMVEAIQNCLTNIRDTNTFMLMTINRCIDYTKVSKGIQLLPRAETIDLMATIQLPLNCMQNIQSKINISVLPPSKQGPSICSHVITDKLWLQENLLCLLSNAVKYSSEGDVTVALRVKKVDRLLKDDDDESDEDEQDIGGVEESISANSSPRLNTSSIIINNNNKAATANANSHSTSNESIRREPLFTLQDGKSDSAEGIPACVPQSRVSLTNGRPNMASVVRSMSQKSGVSLNNNRPLTSLNTNANTKEMLVIEVEDTGIGMTDEAMKNLFNPFKQTQRLAGGTGLGLFSLAKRVEALHGKYGVRRRRDGRQGSLFWFAIPYRPDHFMAEVYNNHSNHSPYHTPRLSTPRSSSFVDPLKSSEPNTKFVGILTGAAPVVSVGIRSRFSSEDIPPIIEEDHEARVPEVSSTVTSPDTTGPMSLDTNPEQSLQQQANKGKPVIPKLMIPIPIDNNIATISKKSPSARMLKASTSLKNSSLPSPKFNMIKAVTTTMTTNNTHTTDKPLHILVVDDSPAILKITSLMLKKLGHFVTTAENGQIAVNLVRDTLADDGEEGDDELDGDVEENNGERKYTRMRFDIILMDLQMPVMDGLEAISRIRATESLCYRESAKSKSRHHWIIGCSANSDMETQQAAMTAGASYFMPKPFNVTSFCAAIADAQIG